MEGIAEHKEDDLNDFDEFEGLSLETLKSQEREEAIRQDIDKADAARRVGCLGDWDKSGIIP